MFNLISMAIGIAALAAAILALMPQFAMATWAIVPLAALGVGVGILSRGDGGRRLNMFVLMVGVVRLVLGAGWF